VSRWRYYWANKKRRETRKNPHFIFSLLSLSLSLSPTRVCSILSIRLRILVDAYFILNMNVENKSDTHNDAPEIESHMRDRAGMVREFRGRRSDFTIRTSDGGEFHGHQGATRSHLLGGIGPDQGERI
jgi:hypothetical protein